MDVQNETDDGEERTQAIPVETMAALVFGADETQAEREAA